MVLTLVIVAGYLFGSFLNWVSDFLPKFSGDKYQFSVRFSDTNQPTYLKLLNLLSWPRLYRGQKYAGLHFCVEVGMSFLTASFWKLMGSTVSFYFLTIICSFLLLIALIDLKHRLIPNLLIIPAIVLITPFQLIVFQQDIGLSLLGGFVGFLLFGLVKAVSRGKLGGGDIKLAGFLGLLFGFPYLFWPLLLGTFTGAVVSILLLVTNYWKTETSFPYAPFLSFGAIVGLFFDPTSLLLSL